MMWTWQNTALHIAARAGHVAAVRLMLVRGAEFVLNKNQTSFLHEALQNGRKDVVNTVIDSDRCATEASHDPNNTKTKTNTIWNLSCTFYSWNQPNLWISILIS